MIGVIGVVEITGSIGFMWIIGLRVLGLRVSDLGFRA